MFSLQRNVESLVLSVKSFTNRNVIRNFEELHVLRINITFSFLTVARRRFPDASFLNGN